MTFRFGDVVLSRLPFHQSDGSKIRPAVVVLDVGDDDFMMAPVTSRLRHSSHEYLIQDWSAAGLVIPSSVRLDKITVLAKDAIIRSLGKLNRVDREGFASLLSNVFCISPPQ